MKFENMSLQICTVLRSWEWAIPEILCLAVPSLVFSGTSFIRGNTHLGILAPPGGHAAHPPGAQET